MMASEHDPHDIAPDGFFERFDGVKQASWDLSSTTDRADLTRCPECASTSITPKGDPIGSACDHRKPGGWRCKSCYCHFSEPAPSANDEDVPDHADCRGSRTSVRARPGEKDWYCHCCGTSFDAEDGGGD